MPHLQRILLILLLLIGPVPAVAGGPSLLFDPVSGEVLSQDRAGEPWYPASLTKLMTAYIVFQKVQAGGLTLKQKVPVSAAANSQPPSKIGMPVGANVSVNFALEAMLIYSANDMAYVLAEASSGTVAAFAMEMNQQARRLGMNGSHFVNPNGLFDPRQISTARDLALLASAILRDFPEYGRYFSKPFMTVGKRKLANRNSLLRQMPQADGMKTGFVCGSGFNLVATATRDGRQLGAVILGAGSGKHRADLAEMLLTDGFSRSVDKRPQLQTLENVPTGSFVPADMTNSVCRNKPLTLARSSELGGWGISFGNYESAATADMALRGRMLSPSGIGLPGSPGIIRLPENRGFAAAVWNLDESTSVAACIRYHRENAPCEVISPTVFAKIAALLPDRTQGSSSTPQGENKRKPKAGVPVKKKSKS